MGKENRAMSQSAEREHCDMRPASEFENITIPLPDAYSHRNAYVFIQGQILSLRCRQCCSFVADPLAVNVRNQLPRLAGANVCAQGIDAFATERRAFLRTIYNTLCCYNRKFGRLICQCKFCSANMTFTHSANTVRYVLQASFYDR